MFLKILTSWICFIHFIYFSKLVFIFMSVKMAAKSKHVELNEDFIYMWKNGKILWDVTPCLYCERDARSKSLKRLGYYHK